MIELLPCPFCSGQNIETNKAGWIQCVECGAAIDCVQSWNTRAPAQQKQDPDLLATYRDIFAEITAKATPVCAPAGDDPDRVRHYIVPTGPIHRAAGKLNFQMFDGEAHLARAIADLARARNAAIEECAGVCEGGEWTRHATHHSPTKSCAIAIRELKGAAFPSTEGK